MEISLIGQRALVGGASSGLGKATAIQLAQCGAEVILMARNEEKLKLALAALPTDLGQHHSYLVVDFANFEQLKSAITSWFKNNPVDILVNNTNGPSPGGVLEKTVDDYQEAFDLLFKSVCFITTEALKGMITARHGRIINLTSTSVKEPLQNLVLSNTIRSAVVAWGKTLAREIAASGITVNTILTGNFDTERLEQIHHKQAAQQGLLPADYRAGVQQAIPAGRFGEPEELGHLVAFLASGFASYITGASIPIDGGLLRSI